MFQRQPSSWVIAHSVTVNLGHFYCWGREGSTQFAQRDNGLALPWDIIYNLVGSVRIMDSFIQSSSSLRSVDLYDGLAAYLVC